MQKIDVIEYLPTIMGELKKGILINTKNGDKTNTMTISWGQIGIEWGKMFFTTYIRHGRFTHEQIEASKEFTISVPLDKRNRMEMAKAIGYCGQEQNIENIPQEIKDTCYPQDVPSDEPRANKDYHTVYYGEIVNAYIL